MPYPRSFHWVTSFYITDRGWQSDATATDNMRSQFGCSRFHILTALLARKSHNHMVRFDAVSAWPKPGSRQWFFDESKLALWGIHSLVLGTTPSVAACTYQIQAQWICGLTQYSSTYCLRSPSGSKTWTHVFIRSRWAKKYKLLLGSYHRIKICYALSKSTETWTRSL